MPIRLITTLVLILGAFIAPWWSVGLGIVLCIFAYRRFFEALVPSLIIDVLYGTHLVIGIPAFVTVLTVTLILVSLLSDNYLRSHVRI